MAEDSRESSKAVSGSNDIPAGNSSTRVVKAFRNGETFASDTVHLDYAHAGTTNAKVTLYDESEGTAAGNLTDKIDSFHVSPGETVHLSNVTYADVEEDLVALADGAQDAEITVTVGGFVVTG